MFVGPDGLLMVPKPKPFELSDSDQRYKYWARVLPRYLHLFLRGLRSGGPFSSFGGMSLVWF